MAQSNQVVPVNISVTPDQREAFFRVENHKSWPTTDPVKVVEKHRDLDVEQVGQARFKVTWGDRPLAEPMWVTVAIGSVGMERTTVRLTPAPSSRGRGPG
jgi:hypothetical protein